MHTMHMAPDISDRVPPRTALDEALRGFGQQMRAQRERLGLRQKDVAAALGIDQSQCSRMEGGELDPSLVTVLRIQALLEVRSLEDFFGRQPTGRLAPTSDDQPDP